MKKIFTTILKRILKLLSHLIILRFEPQVIAITGSVGKTSAKEAVYAVLNKHFRVRKSTGNLNNELGIPLAIIGDWTEEELKLVSRDTPTGKKRVRKIFFWFKVIFSAKKQILFAKKNSYPDILILEYAADRPGDIKYLLEIAKPKIGIITAIGEIPVHVEFFSGPEAVAKEKAKLIENLSVNNFAILNFDNELTIKMKEQTRARVISFGLNNDSSLPTQVGLSPASLVKAEPDLKISNFENRFQKEDETPIGISFKIEYNGSFVPVVLKNVFGRAHVYAAAIAACVGLIFDLNLVQISDALSNHYKPVKGRMNLIKGIKETYIIDDSYNASPISMEESLKTFSDLPAKRKIAILGDMLELGKYSIEAHEDIGRLVAKITNILVTIGPRAKFIAEAAKSNNFPENKILSFDSSHEACLAVQNFIKEGDLILIKASRAMELDKIVEEIRKM
ncbi:UDP-N-acetylmuramoyl-tripeptide--D-alanyl-D-alanine ligase [Candidatus Wolfebacteria bacterium]|nr:UDP-N-acetylmuramoyl-tripeptide--D-alanyl-D-alanine ligase [Candidatus Wolfebacteria bacterium]